jgi:hypothetical protein
MSDAERYACFDSSATTLSVRIECASPMAGSAVVARPGSICRAVLESKESSAVDADCDALCLSQVGIPKAMAAARRNAVNLCPKEAPEELGGRLPSSMKSSILSKI